jgi:hypothetical protein
MKKRRLYLPTARWVTLGFAGKRCLVSTPNPNPISALTSHFGCGDWLQIIGYLTADTLTSEGLHDFAPENDMY